MAPNDSEVILSPSRNGPAEEIVPGWPA
jgi:hypothetical protein